MTLFLLALACALAGQYRMLGPPLAAASIDDLQAGAPWLGLAFGIWLLAELRSNWEALRANWRSLDRAGKRRMLLRLLPLGLWIRALSLLLGAMSAGSAWPFLAEALSWLLIGAIFWLLIELAHRGIRVRAVTAPRPFPPREHLRPRLSLSGIARRIALLALAIMASGSVWLYTADNRIDPPTLALWLGSGLLWSLVFAPAGANAFEWLTSLIDRFRRISLRAHGGILVAFALIMLLGAAFRFARLDQVPREMMYSDHSVDIHAAYQASRGDFMIMVRHWHMQEAMHIYFIVALASLPGLEIDFHTVKLVAALESLLALPLVFWAGCELLRHKGRRLAVAAALILMGLVAASYWHNVATRYAQRTHLVVVFSALTLVFLARAMRGNRRADFICLGLTLGLGMYAYTACRMLPLLAVAGTGLALTLRRITWRERLRYLVNLAIAAFIALMLYLPLLHVSIDFPREFYINNTGPVFGTEPGAPLELDLDWFVTGLLSNFRLALLMFNWIGDPNPLQSVTWHPALDPLTGALLVVGLAAWLACLMRDYRDPILWLIPALIIIMLLPVALSVTDSATVPANTRSAGAMPGVYLLASLALVRLGLEIRRVFPQRIGLALAGVGCALIVLFSNAYNAALIFDHYAHNTMQAPYSHIGKTVRALLDSGLTWGNIFFVPHASDWAMHNVFIEAGQPDWHYWTMLEDVPDHLEHGLRLDGARRLNPQRDLVFLYPAAHEAASAQLKAWFPQGGETAVHSDLPAEHALGSYMIFRVPGASVSLLTQRG